ncbi:MAG: type VI secretion system tube protein Hcp [Acidobacteriia bacterium]|nr:type VI secretion system tube protein Hcp [Terriglobia bacterium]
MPIYLKLGTVQGDSKAKGHVGWIEVDSANFGVPRVQRSGTSGEAPTVHDMTFTKQTDSSSAALFRIAAGGGQPQPATVDFVDNDGDIFLRFELSDAVITAFNVSSSKESRSFENFTLNFGKMVTRHFTSDTTTEGLEVLHKLLFTQAQP